MDLVKILQGFRDIADRHALLHEEAMNGTHKINLCGLKRLHRHAASKFHKRALCISNFALDHGMEVKFSDPKPGYKVSNLKEHLTMFSAMLEKDLAALKKLNATVLQECGVEFKDGVKMQHRVCQMWAKMKFRWIPRFEFTKWSAEDIVSWDKWLHDKLRCKEEHKHHHHGCPYCHQHGHKM